MSASALRAEQSTVLLELAALTHVAPPARLRNTSSSDVSRVDNR